MTAKRLRHYECRRIAQRRELRWWTADGAKEKRRLLQRLAKAEQLIQTFQPSL